MPTGRGPHRACCRKGASRTAQTVGMSLTGSCHTVPQLYDGRLVEAVGIPSETSNRLTACVSSQARCSSCKSCSRCMDCPRTSSMVGLCA